MSFKVASVAQEFSRKVLAQNPPGGEAPVEGPAEAPSAESGSTEGAASPEPGSPQPKKKMNFKSVDAYSLRLEGGFGWRNFQNGQKLDHDGGMFRLGAGLRIPVAKRLTLSPRLAYEYQGLKKPLGFDVVSRATAHMVGLELDLGIAVHPKWFSLHPILGLGAAIYRAPGNTEGTIGAEFNKNALLFPLKDSGARVELGLQLCTWGDAICLGAKFAGDMGINPTLEVVDAPEGGNPSMGLNPLGASVSAGVDIFRIVSNLRNRKKPAEKIAEPASTHVIEEPILPSDNAAEETLPPTAPEEGSSRVPPALPSFTVADFEEGLKEIRTEHGHVLGNLKLAQRGLEKIKDPSMKRSDKKINAEGARSFYRRSYEKTQSVEVVIAGLSDAYGKMETQDPEEDAKAFALLQEALALYKEMAASTVETHGIAEDSVNAYNKRRGSLEVVEFADPKPEYPILSQE